ncbi:hypothetical protein ISS85_04155, partial [Candidatus Microgenomates bacterium]|nr:hypothetical protein [Candidatus Microgenomates bacterium]
KMKFYLSRYLTLLSIFVIGFSFFVYFDYNRSIQVWCVIAMSLAYFLWGMIHHYLEKNLYLKVVIEYFLIALLGAVLIISLIYRA